MHFPNSTMLKLFEHFILNNIKITNIQYMKYEGVEKLIRLKEILILNTLNINRNEYLNKEKL